MTNELKIPPRPGGEVKLPPEPEIPENEQKRTIVLLQSGDVVDDWTVWLGNDVQSRHRYVVGRIVGFIRHPKCEFCGSTLYWQNKEEQHRRYGPDGREYIRSKCHETNSRICPQCRHETNRFIISDY